MRQRETFTTPFDQYAEHNGRTFKILRKISDAEYDADECGPLYEIKLSNGLQIQAWPEEIFHGPMIE